MTASAPRKPYAPPALEQATAGFRATEQLARAVGEAAAEIAELEDRNAAAMLRIAELESGATAQQGVGDAVDHAIARAQMDPGHTFVTVPLSLWDAVVEARAAQRGRG